MSFDPTSDVIHIRENIYLITKPPTCVYMRIKDTKFKQLDGLDENVIPIPKQGMKVSVIGGKFGTCKVKRIQVPCCPAFAITHYKAQGYTFDKIMVDIEVNKGSKF